MKKIKMKINTFKEKITNGFQFYYATFKGYGWSGNHIDWTLQDIKSLERDNIKGFVTVSIEEQKDIVERKNREKEALKEREKEKELKKIFRFSFRYRVAVQNNLTVNRYQYEIDKVNQILKMTWNGIVSYYKLTGKEINEYEREWKNYK